MSNDQSTAVSTREPNWAAPAVPLPIASHDDYQEVASALKSVKAFSRNVKEFFGPLKEKARAAHKALVEKEKETLAPAQAWEQECKTAMLAWDEKQEALRLAEQRRREAEAREAEEARRLEEAAALEAEAEASGDEGLKEEAEALLAEPIATPVVVAEKTTPKVKGVKYRDNWSATVTDLHALIRHVADHPEHTHLLTPSTKALNSLARALKDQMAVPGVQAVNKRVVAA